MATEHVTVEGGKYTVVIGDRGELSALRYGEPWQDLAGNKMVYCLATELVEARKPRNDFQAGALAQEARIAALQDLLLRAEDAIEALDGTSVENERLVDDYREFIRSLKRVKS